MSLYFTILSASFSITFLSPEIATSINGNIHFPLSRISWIMLSGCTGLFHNVVTLTSWFLYVNFGTRLYRYLFTISTHAFFNTLNCVIIIIWYICLLSQAFLPGTSLEPAVIPTTQVSSFTLQYFPYYVWCSKYSCLL